VPINITTEQLHILLNQLLNNEEKRPYSFFVNEEEIIETVKGTWLRLRGPALRLTASAEGIILLLQRRSLNKHYLRRYICR